MTEKKFNIDDKVLYKGNLCVVKYMCYTYFPDGARWMYDVDNGSFVARVAETNLELATTPSAKKKSVRTKKNSQKRKK